MKLLLDECVPRRLKFGFAEQHEILTIDEAGLKGLKNGNLIRSLSGSFEVLVTVDKNIQHQQNIEKLSIAILIFIGKKHRSRITLAVDSKSFKNSRKH